MKYTTSRKARINRLANIYVEVDSIHEYKCQADLLNISRKNYLFVFDPIMFYWCIKTHGQWPRFAVGIGFQLISTLDAILCYGITSKAAACGAIVGILALIVFDIGRKIGEAAVEAAELERGPSCG